MYWSAFGLLISRGDSTQTVQEVMSGWEPHQGAPLNPQQDWEGGHVAAWFCKYFQIWFLRMSEAQRIIIEKLLEELGDPLLKGIDLWDPEIVQDLKSEITGSAIQDRFLKGVEAFKALTDYYVKLMLMKHPDPKRLRCWVLLCLPRQMGGAYVKEICTCHNEPMVACTKPIHVKLQRGVSFTLRIRAEHHPTEQYALPRLSKAHHLPAELVDMIASHLDETTVLWKGSADLVTSIRLREKQPSIGIMVNGISHLLQFQWT